MTDAYVEATGLSLETRTGPVFTDVTFALPRGGLSLVAGRSGTGRSALLLALAGRMRGLTGTLRVAGFDSASQSKQIRTNVAVARIARLVDLEGQLTVGDCITERALTDAVKPDRATGVFTHAERILDHAFDRGLLVDELPALDRTLLSVALATLRPAHVIVLDDADRGLTSDELVTLLDALARLAETGVTVIASVLDASHAPATATVVPLLHPSAGPSTAGLTPAPDAQAVKEEGVTLESESTDADGSDPTGPAQHARADATDSDSGHPDGSNDSDDPNDPDDSSPPEPSPRRSRPDPDPVPPAPPTKTAPSPSSPTTPSTV